MYKSKEGITLIALVITIIVLLILAGISIVMLTGENGLLTKAGDSKEASRGGEVKEFVDLTITDNSFSDYINSDLTSKQTVINDLHSRNKLTDEEVTYLTDHDVITIGGIEIDFSGLNEKKYFYIYHSSNCTVERVAITNANSQGFDLTARVNGNCYYGGYYSTFGGSTTDVTQLTYTYNKATDTNGESYDGMSSKTSANEKFWIRDNAYTESGESLIPVEGVVYYVNEIPKGFLDMNKIVVVTTATDVIEEIYFISAIDSLAYKEKRNQY